MAAPFRTHFKLPACPDVLRLASAVLLGSILAVADGNASTLSTRLPSCLGEILGPFESRADGDYGFFVLRNESVFIKQHTELVPLVLSPSEQDILTLLIRYPGRVFTRNELFLKALDGSDAIDRIIDAHIANIRRRNPLARDYVLSRTPVGYFVRETVEHRAGRHELMRVQKSRQLFEYGRFRIDEYAKTIFIDETPLQLPMTQHAILAVLVKSKGRTCDFNALADAAGEEIKTSLRVHMSHVRKALRPHGADTLIITLPEVGYKLGTN